MIREIKLKAFDKVTKILVDLIGFKDLGNKLELWYLNKKNEESYSIVEKQYIELIESTGLKDKDDKEIYEGDIIKLTYADKKTVYKCTVKYDEYSAYYMLEDVMDSDNFDVFCGFSNEQFEVIGNIYENPELLKE